MEVKRHERSILIIVSYIIGFVTAFIFYQDKLKRTEAFNNPDYINTAILFENQKKQALSNQQNLITPPTSSPIDNKTISRGEKLDKEELIILDTISITSSNGAFSFFCKPASAEGLCRAYILDIQNSLSYPVVLENNELLFSDSLIPDIKWNNDYLKIGDFVSISSEKPWLLHELIPH